MEGAGAHKKYWIARVEALGTAGDLFFKMEKSQFV